jgi:hypothetical protein
MLCPVPDMRHPLTSTAPRVLSALLLPALVLLLFAVGGRSAGAQQTVDPAFAAKWDAFPFDKRRVDPAELKKLTPGKLKWLRGILFGKHGRVFDERFIQDYLEQRPWYKPDPKYRVEVLNAVERENMDRIKAAEHALHQYIEPGDLKFYRNKTFSEAQLGKHTGVEWVIMMAEVEAIHGKTFPDQPFIQAFYDQRYWYKPDPTYTAKRLSAAERANLETMRRAWKKQRGLSVSPGDMGQFRDQPLKPEMLTGLSLSELRLLRNEVYARHGYSFQAWWLQSYFYDQPWYRQRPDGDNTKVRLSPAEERNVAVILKREQALHESLSKETIDESYIAGLYAEDVRKLRNEIYARRGYVFKDRWLRSYFESLPWYTPNPDFRETDLTPIERKNATFLAQREKKLESVIRQVAA